MISTKTPVIAQTNIEAIMQARSVYTNFIPEIGSVSSTYPNTFLEVMIVANVPSIKTSELAKLINRSTP